MMMKPCQTLLNENMQQKERKKNKGKGPKSWNTNKTQKKGKPPRGRGTHHVPNPPPLTRNIKRFMLEKLDKNTHYCGSFLNVCIR